jgi:hypothetical protein
MKAWQIVGWKTYAVAVLSLIIGVWSLAYGYTADGIKGIIFGFALIALRDATAKILRAVDDTCKTLSSLRATIEAELKRGRR